METSCVLEGNVLTVAITGRLDTNTAPEFNEGIKADLAGAERLVLDMAGVDYVSSAGLRVILALQKSMAVKGGMIIRNVNDGVMEVFEATGMTDALDIQ